MEYIQFLSQLLAMCRDVVCDLEHFCALRGFISEVKVLDEANKGIVFNNCLRLPLSHTKIS